MEWTNEQLIETARIVSKYESEKAAQLLNELATRFECSLLATRTACSERSALAAENAYLLNGAARELNTSWMFHKTMLGAQAALVCLSHGYQAAAREWLEGTTDEAGAEIHDDISVGELHEWFESKMVSNDGKSGFLTRGEAEVKIRAECPATDAFLAEVRAQGVEAFANSLKVAGVGEHPYSLVANEFAAQLRQEAAK